MDRRAFDLAPVGRIAAAGFGVILGVDLDDVPIFVALAARAVNEVSALETALGALRIKTLILGNGLGQEIVRLDPEVPGERDGVRALLGMDGVIFDLEGLRLVPQGSS